MNTTKLKLVPDPDIGLEDRIQAAYQHCIRVWTREAWLELVRLIKLRRQ